MFNAFQASNATHFSTIHSHFSASSFLLFLFSHLSRSLAHSTSLTLLNCILRSISYVHFLKCIGFSSLLGLCRRGRRWRQRRRRRRCINASLLSHCTQIIPFYFPFMCNRMFSTLSTDLNRMQWHKMPVSNGKSMETGCLISTSAIRFSTI